MVIKEIDVKDIMTKTNLPVSDYAVNPYRGRVTDEEKHTAD